jgi:hypothetical protein
VIQAPKLFPSQPFLADARVPVPADLRASCAGEDLELTDRSRFTPSGSSMAGSEEGRGVRPIGGWSALDRGLPLEGLACVTHGAAHASDWPGGTQGPRRANANGRGLPVTARLNVNRGSRISR